MNVSPSLSLLAQLAPGLPLADPQGGSSSTFDSLFSILLDNPGAGTGNSAVDALFTPPAANAGAALHAGRNMALFDPESAYSMMTLINNKDVLYKAQYAELSQMGDAVEKMRQAGIALGEAVLEGGSVESALRAFISQYNDWVQRFNPDMQNGGVLAGTQAAQVSRYELEQSVSNIFNGAGDGLHGLASLGVSVDATTGLLALDATKLHTVLQGNERGVADTLQEFSASFAKSAELLNADNNFIPNQLDNLHRAISYISDNGASLQQEFGSGAAAQPTGQVALALAEYSSIYGA